MPRKSTQTKIPDQPPKFQSEAQEADWWASPAGQRFTERLFHKSMKNGTLTTSQGVPDPDKLQALFKDARASMTKQVPLRIPIRDIEAAKAIGNEKGIGYQTVLKQIIHEGLRNAS